MGADVYTLDGVWKGKFAGFYQGQDGRTYLVVRKLRILPKSSRTFKHKKRRVAHKYLDHLYKQSEAEPDKYKPLLAMLSDEGYDYLPLDDPKGEILLSSDKMILVQRNKDWLPMPLVSLLESSPSQRDQLAELYTLYNTYLRYERPQLNRKLMVLTQLDRANQRLINTLMYENDKLTKTAAELSTVVNNSYRMVADLTHALEFFNDLYEMYKRQSAGWEEAFAKAIEAYPQMAALVDEIRKQMSKALDLSMELDVSEWTGKQAMLEAIQRYREQLKQLEQQAVSAAAAPVVSQVKGGGSSGKEGKASSGQGSEEAGSSGGEGGQ